MKHEDEVTSQGAEEPNSNSLVEDGHSSQESEELNFTLDHFGENTSPQENHVSMRLGTPAVNMEPISTSTRENLNPPEYLERRARRNRGVPPSRLDL